MSRPKHVFADYVLDPVPTEHWRNGNPILGLKLGFCETCGFYHVDPYPTADYLSEYYGRYEMPTAQANLAETARLLARNISPNDKVVDMGCGDGSFLKELYARGFTNLEGFDQSPGLERAMNLGFGRFYRTIIWDYLAKAETDGGADAQALVMVNVLEHVTEPLELLARVWGVLPEGGLLCVTVPNDFSPLQQAFLKAKGHRPWFVCLPDHLNYYSFSTLESTFARTGFEVIEKSALYPLELFLLQDLDYIADPALGPVAHQRRVMFEENMKIAGMTDALDHFYQTLAAGGYGRNIMMVARKIGHPVK